MTQPLLQSVQNALRVIELFEGTVTEISLTEISRNLGLGKSTVYRLLSTLESRGFIEQNPETGRYRLGMRLVHIAASKLGSINVIDECHPMLERLSLVTGETTSLSFYANTWVTLVDVVSSATSSMLATIIGHSFPAHASASGKVFLAHMDNVDREELLRFMEFTVCTPYTLTNRMDLLSDLERVRLNGYGEDQQEGNEGLVSFSAPVWGYENRLLAAISVTGAASRMNARKDILTREVLAAARSASKRCGWVAS